MRRAVAALAWLVRELIKFCGPGEKFCNPWSPLAQQENLFLPEGRWESSRKPALSI
jgi:hypothetical protein